MVNFVNRISAITLLILQGTFAPAQQPRPKATDVLRAFYNRYDISGLQYPYIELEKRNRSWYVCELSFDGGKPRKQNRQLFYDAGREEYLKLTYASATQNAVAKADSIAAAFDGYYFDVQPSYGYAGWYQDVISDYRQQKQLTDDELYSLARAYSAAASALLGNQFGDALEEQTFDPPLQQNSLTENQTDEYLNLSDTAQRLFRSLAERNPVYATKVGDIAMKAANETMVPYHKVMVHAEAFLPKVKLPQKLYHPDTLSKIQLMMAACPRNSVFLSFGDNDFYPVMYLQSQGYRPDIYLVNYSLLGLDRYIFRSTHRQFNANGLPIPFDTADYKGERNNYLYLNASQTVLPFDSVVKLMKAGASEMPSKRIRLGSSQPVSKTAGKVIELFGNYILKDQLMLLSILNVIGNRPFCAGAIFEDQLKGLNDFLTYNGGVYIYKN